MELQIDMIEKLKNDRGREESSNVFKNVFAHSALAWIRPIYVQIYFRL